MVTVIIFVFGKIKLLRTIKLKDMHVKFCRSLLNVVQDTKGHEKEIEIDDSLW